MRISLKKTFLKKYRSLLTVVTLRKLKAMRFLAILLATVLICLSIQPVFAVFPTLQSPASENSLSLSQGSDLLEEGQNFYKSQDYNSAIKVLKAAVQTTKDPLQLAIIYSNLSLSYQQVGQWPEAETAINRSLDKLKKTGPTKDREIYSQALDIKGRLHFNRGQNQAALDSWEKSKQIYTLTGDTQRVAKACLNQANAAQALGLHYEAQRLLDEAQKSLKTESDPELKATILISLGINNRFAGDLKHLKQSKQALEQAVLIAKASQSPLLVSKAQLSFADTLWALGDHKTALQYYQQTAKNTTPDIRLQALTQQFRLLNVMKPSAAVALLPSLKEQLKDHVPGRISLRANISISQELIDSELDTDPLEIASFLTKALEESRYLEDKRSESFVLGTLGHLYEKSQQSSSALKLTREALALAEPLNEADLIYRWQGQIGRLLQISGDTEGAITAYTDAVAQLKKLRRENQSNINNEQQLSFNEDIEPVYRQLINLHLQQTNIKQLKQTSIVSAREVVNELQIAELYDYLGGPCLMESKQIDTLDEQAAIIIPIVFEDRLEVMYSLPNPSTNEKEKRTLDHFTQNINEVEVKELITELRMLLADGSSDKDEIPTSAKKVYDLLLEPIQTKIDAQEIKKLVFVPDGPFQMIPMSILHDGEKYLIQKEFSIAIAPSAWLPESTALEGKSKRALIAGVTQENSGFLPLANVDTEIDLIKKNIPSQVIKNNDFTSKKLGEKLGAAPVPIVHIATHSEFSSDPNATYIQAWKEKINLQALGELVRNQDLNSSSKEDLELLVLSSCSSARGDKQAALGLAGVTVRAGARSTLASLWLVDDETTPNLMKDFYGQLKGGARKAEALSFAQRKFIDGEYGEYAKHPRYWSAFILLGNWL